MLMYLANTHFPVIAFLFFFLNRNLDDKEMQLITREMRHFESIFLYPLNFSNTKFRAKIFTLEEELDFAGHPILGAACAIHDKYFPNQPEARTNFKLNIKSLDITTKKHSTYYSAMMEQGAPEFITEVPSTLVNDFLAAFNLSPDNLARLPLEVISTGLSYLIVPLVSGLEQIKHHNVSHLLSKIKAKFVYFYDINRQEGRTWDNNGIIEDIATGSAAGPLSAYLVKHGIHKTGEIITINQGSFLNRPSVIEVVVLGENNEFDNIKIFGNSCIIGEGIIQY